jgi:predicted PurR-regulated permease PerM
VVRVSLPGQLEVLTATSIQVTPKASPALMPTEKSGDDKEHIRRGLELCIYIGLVILLVGSCLLILRPFLPLVVWGIIIAISTYPAFKKLQTALGGRRGLAAVICTVAMLAVLIAPVILLTGTLVEGAQSLSTRMKDGTLTVPPPPPNVESWFLIGRPLNRMWSSAATDLSAALATLSPQIKAAVPALFSTSADIALTVLQFALSILLAGVLLANAQAGAAVSHSLANRLFGNKGPEFEELAGATIRNVTTGILGVALIQSMFAAIGFLMVGIPGAGFWSLMFMFAAVLQITFVVLIPAVIYVFAIASTTKAIIFLIWCVFVGLLNNVLAPLLLGRGASVPMAVVFLGAIGGFLAMGIIGLFVGAIVLSVGYKLFLAWLYGASQVANERENVLAAEG